MKRVSYVVSLFLFVTSLAYAELAPGFEGPFALNPKVMHKGPVTGVMSLLFESGVFTSIQIDLDKPLLEQKIYLSKEQTMVAVDRENTPSQISVIYKLEGPIHKWYFVVVANATEADRMFSGNIYKVGASMDEILGLVKEGIDNIPSTWKLIGTASLSEHVASIIVVN
ncbi:MAG: hypothetical protein HYW47_06670 [Deltaproteobacteria bacterium]|nr:hypothetical protein [Deltaproteobacteria bacterium]